MANISNAPKSFSGAKLDIIGAIIEKLQYCPESDNIVTDWDIIVIQWDITYLPNIRDPRRNMIDF